MHYGYLLIFLLISTVTHWSQFRCVAGTDVTNAPCLINCTTTFAAATISGDTPDGTDFFFLNAPDGATNENSIEKTCKGIKFLKSCIDGCKETPEHTAILLKGFSGIELFCSKRQELSKEAPCISGFRRRDKCKKELFTAWDETTSLIATIPTIISLTPEQPQNAKSRFRIHLSNLCKSVDEEAQCMLPVVTRQCGAKAACILSEVFTATLKGLNELSQLGKVERDLIPPECEKILMEDYGQKYSKLLPEPPAPPPV